MADSVFLSLIGVVGTLAGGGLTGFISARSERRKECALAQQQARQEHAQERKDLRELRVEQQRWRRERRQTASQNFLDALHVFRNASGRRLAVLRAGVGPPNKVQAQEERSATQDALWVAQRACNTVQLEGPAVVASAAAECLKKMHDVLHSLDVDDFHNAQHVEDALVDGLSELEDLARRQQHFVGRARAALDDAVTLT